LASQQQTIEWFSELKRNNAITTWTIKSPGVERDIVQHRDMDIERIIEEKTQSV